jgi:hypothetical protein
MRVQNVVERTYKKKKNVVERTYQKKGMLLKGIEGITVFDKGGIYLHY